MVRLTLAAIALVLALPTMAMAQIQFGPITAMNTIADALPTCSANVISNYVVTDPVSADTCDGGGTPLFAQLNYCVCDKNILEWKVLASTLTAGGGGGVSTVFGRSGAVTAQSGDYTVGQVVGALASSSLASTSTGQGASLIGIEDAGSIFTAVNVEAALAELNARILSTEDDVPESGDFGNAAALEADGSISDGAINSIGQIDATLRTGTDGQLVTGTAGTAGNCVEYDATGDLVEAASGLPCGSGVGGGATNLTATPAASQVTINSDTGTDATIPAANASDAGVLSAADKILIDALEALRVAGTLGAPVAVSSNGELNAYFQSLVLPSATNTETIMASVILADDYTYDPAIPIRWYLPTGGSDAPIISIDFNGHILATSGAKKNVTLFYGSTDGAGTPTPCVEASGDEYYLGSSDVCGGVQHDAIVIVRNGHLSSDYAGCDGAPTALCERYALATEGDDQLVADAGIAAVSGDGLPYATRLYLIDTKLGGHAGRSDLASANPQLDLRGDASLSVGAATQTYVSGASYWEGDRGFHQRPWADVIDPTTQGAATTTIGGAFRWRLTSINGPANPGGFFDFNAPMAGNSIALSGEIDGPIGFLNGGNVDFRIRGDKTGANCEDTTLGADSYMLDGGSSTEELNGRIEISGDYCFRGIARLGTVGMLDLDLVLSGSKPGTFVDDSDLSIARYPAITTTSGGDIQTLRIRAHLEDPIDTADFTYDDLLDADILSGAAMRGASSSVTIDIGDQGFCAKVGTSNSGACDYQSSLGPIRQLAGDPATRSIATTGTIKGGTVYAPYSFGDVVPQIDCLGEVHPMIGGPFELTLEAVSAPAKEECTFYALDDAVYTITPNAADRIQINGVDLADGVSIVSNGARGDRVRIASNNVNGWIVLSERGWSPLPLVPADIGSSVQAWDADLDDLADGTLSGAKIGTGISGSNITAGTVADARIDSALLRTSEIDTSAKLRAIISDESGTGSALFAGGDIGAATGTSLVTSSFVAGYVRLANSQSAGDTLTESQCLGDMIALTGGPYTTVLPLVAAPFGESCCFRNLDGAAYSIDPDAADRIQLDGNDLADGVTISSSTAGDQVCLLQLGAAGGNWYSTSNVGWVSP